MNILMYHPRMLLVVMKIDKTLYLNIKFQGRASKQYLSEYEVGGYTTATFVETSSCLRCGNPLKL
jgi:hypothetical protein